MGRGRQKAKQTKVARDLKYFTPATDYRALEKELTTGQHSQDNGNSKAPVAEAEAEVEAEYADWYSDER